MSFDALSRFPECVSCNEGIDINDPDNHYTVINREYHHAHCIVSAEYAKEIKDLLTSGRTQTRSPAEHPLLSQSESEELIEDFLLGIPAIVFARKLEVRDLDAFHAECT